MTDIERRVTYEADDVYLARTFDEAYHELIKVKAGVQCSSFSSVRTQRCEWCSMYSVPDGEGKEKCMLTLALNYLAAVRNIAKTGKP